MRSNIVISIIIPVYQVAEYLRECIDSVLRQTYTHKEIILVDDGSTDGSEKICDDYAAIEPEIRVIHKTNGGLSDARNKGIEVATGDYIMFLDSDDFWDDEAALDTLVKRISATHPDVINFSFKKYSEESQEKIPYFKSVRSMPPELKQKEDQLQYLADHNLYVSGAWAKIIKRELFSLGMCFDPGVTSEDVEWSARLMKKADTMDFVYLDFYCYRQRKNSISHSIKDKNCRDLCSHIIECIKLSQECGPEKYALKKYAAFQLCTFIVVQAQAKTLQGECIDELSKYADILSNRKNSKRITALFWGTKIMGFKNLCRAARSIYGIKRR